jgi:glutathione peroxidase
MKSIDGKDVKLSDFKGKKILIVNVASECGNTPQYAKLEKLYEQYKDKLVILGFPANNFGSQEPGSDKEISSFCTKNYGVTFPMFSKISVKGADKAPLYQWLSDKSKNGVLSEEPDWNFAKYFIDENGKLVAFFPAKTDPMDDKIVTLIKK